MSKLVINSITNNNNKKYIDFLLHVDNKLLNNNNNIIKPKTEIEKSIDLYINFLNEEYTTKYETYIGYKKDTKRKKSLHELNPNLYKGNLLVLLEYEINRLQKNNKKDKNVIINKDISSSDVKHVYKKKIIIDAEINSLEDLLKLIQTYPIDPAVEYNINIESLHRIEPYLIRLQNMIGMNSLKKNILDQILYYIQDLHRGGKGMSRGDYMHTVICGPPGTGKTHIAKIIGKIFSKLGILKSGVFKKVTRSDLVAGYLGQTAIKTRDVINECIDGVLFIDEAYALGNSEKRDSFSKECIDTLCEALSDHKNHLMVIIAGYESELNDCFFNYNQGLNSRFTWRFKIDNYVGEDLYKIFLKKIIDADWRSEDTIKADWFNKNISYFTFFGRDMEILFSKTKIAHSRRVFCKSVEEKKLITSADLENGFKIFLDNEEVKKRKESDTHKFMMNSIYV